jgi:hypothetical protein
VAWSATRCPSGVRGAGVWTRSCQNMAATSEDEEEAVTGRGTKVEAMGERALRVVKSTTGMGAWIVTGVLTGNSCENGMGESAVAPAEYLLRSVDRSVRLGRLGFCPECLMAEVGKRLDYNGVRITERWINTQGESACQALKRIGRKGLCKVFQRKRDEVQGLYKVCTKRMYEGCCRGSTKYTTGTE